MKMLAYARDRFVVPIQYAPITVLYHGLSAYRYYNALKLIAILLTLNPDANSNNGKRRKEMYTLGVIVVTI